MNEEKTPLEEIQEALEIEAGWWNREGMSGNNTVHNNESIWILKMQMQTLMNLVIKKGIATEDEVNLQFKTLMLNDMKMLRAEASRQKLEALVPGDSELQKLGIVDPTGKPFKV